MTGVHGQGIVNRVEPVRLFYLWVKLTIPLRNVSGHKTTDAIRDLISALFQVEVSSIEEGVEADGCQILNIIGVLPTSSFQAEEKSEFVCILRGAIAPLCSDGFPKLE